MDLYPAIGLRGGKCVRLYQGDFDQETVYGEDPVAQALAFQAEIQGIVEEGFVIGTHIQCYRQAVGGVNTGAGGVQG